MKLIAYLIPQSEKSFVFVKIVIRHIYECEQRKEKGLHLLEQVQP